MSIHHNLIFIISNFESFYLSTDGGLTFSKTVALGSSTVINEIAVHPSKAGDVWATTDKGLFHSTDFGKTFEQISGVAEGWQFGEL